MAHPIFDALAALHDESRRRCAVFFLIGTVIAGEWRPREDLPPCFREDVAHAVAREMTVLMEVKHEAKTFWIRDAR